jgi:hypothetical protein
MGLPAQLDDLLGSRLDGVARVQVVHLRRRRFRWLSLIELAIGLVFAILLLACLLVVFVLMAVLGEADFDAEDMGSVFPTPRFFTYWHELQVRFLDKAGTVLSEHTLQPRDAGEGDGVVGSVLNAADRVGLVVVECLGDSPRETLEVWYGGQPLLAHPERREEETCSEELGRRGWEIEVGEGRVRLQRRSKPAGKVGALLGWLGHLLGLPLLFWRGAHRARLGRHWKDLSGVEPALHTLVVDRGGVRVDSTRAGETLFEHQVDARDLLGIAHSATLGFDRDVTRHKPTLRLIERSHGTEVPRSLVPGSSGKLVRDHLIVSAQRLWEGIPGTSQRPTRCPYCGGTYVFEAGVTCPTCGAPPDRLG